MKIAKKRIFLFSLMVFSIIYISGCGYTTGSLLPSNLKTIYVDNFKNEINISNEVTESSRYTLYRPGIEDEITNALVNRFVFDGNLKIATEKNADLILRGKLTAYKQEALRYDRDDNVQEYRVRITINMELENTLNHKISWTETGFAGESTYNTEGRLATSESAAAEEAIEDLVRRVVERTVECW